MTGGIVGCKQRGQQHCAAALHDVFSLRIIQHTRNVSDDRGCEELCINIDAFALQHRA